MKQKSILIATGLLSMVLCLWGCEKEASASDTQASTERYPETQAAEPADTVPPQDGDIVLKTMEAPLADGRVLTLSVMGKQAEYFYGVREVTVSEGTELRQSILIEEAILADGIDGIDAGYSECPSAEASAELKDVNFDGFFDLEVTGWLPNNTSPCYYWCWDPVVQQFEYAFTLWEAEPNPETQQLICWYKVENGLYYTDHYHVNENNEPELVSRDVEDVRPQ